MNFLQPFLQNGRQSKPRVQQLICREDLKKKKTPDAASLKMKKKVHFESEPSIQNDQNKKNCKPGDPKEGQVPNEEKCAVQVKILMRKEEATLLLSKCNIGGVLQFEDVLRISNCRAHAFSSNKKDD
ncbi:hypothetical protein AAHA92_13513 [Salvia divinorum]|uniref:DUF7890 domain-containing protein n=1 Tax=Salvia divinorum TaxID=28513 RepID=A0ABD1H8H1_SALDI